MQGISRFFAGSSTACVLAVALSAAPVGAQAHTARAIAAEARAAVLVIKALTASGDTVGVGTGFVIREDGVFVTNYHVVQPAARLQVETLDGAVYRDVSVLAVDAPRDLAILKLPARGMRPLPLGRDTDAQVGDRIYLMGNPLGMSGSFSDGLVSARRPVEGVAMLQVTAPISPGSSGGPVIDEQGRVIGVATLFASGGQGLGLAVPVRYVRPLLEAASTPRPFAPGVLGKAPPQGLVLVGASHAPVHGGSGARQVERHFESLGPLLHLQGLAPTLPSQSGAAGESETRTHTFRLEAGVRYLVSAFCDAECGKMELEVFGAEERARVRMDGTSPTLSFAPSSAGTYRVVVRMAECEAEACAYGIGVFHPARGGAAIAAP